LRKTRKDIREYSKATISLGLSTAIGAGIAAKSPMAAPMMTGFSTTAKFMAPMGMAMMGGNVLRILKKTQTKTRRKRRKERR